MARAQFGRPQRRVGTERRSTTEAQRNAPALRLHHKSRLAKKPGGLRRSLDAERFCASWSGQGAPQNIGSNDTLAGRPGVPQREAFAHRSAAGELKRLRVALYGHHVRQVLCLQRSEQSSQQRSVADPVQLLLGGYHGADERHGETNNQPEANQSFIDQQNLIQGRDRAGEAGPVSIKCELLASRRLQRIRVSGFRRLAIFVPKSTKSDVLSRPP